MKPETQRVLIAEACGWKVYADNPMGEPHTGLCGTPDGSSEKLQPLPNYLNDLNAMHEVEKTLTSEQFFKYCEMLGEVLDNRTSCHGTRDAWRIHASAQYRAEAFLRCRALWKENDK